MSLETYGQHEARHHTCNRTPRKRVRGRGSMKGQEKIEEIMAQIALIGAQRIFISKELTDPQDGQTETNPHIDKS